MNTTNLLSKIVNSDKLETAVGINQALECIGVEPNSSNLNYNQAYEIEKVILEKFASLFDIKSVVESIKDKISLEELENFKRELIMKLNNVSTTKAPVYQKRMDALKSCFDEVSGDNVL